MKRTTVLLPDETAELLRLEAERRGVTPSEIVREAVLAHINGKPGEAKGFLKLAAAFSGPAPHDAARRMDALFEGMAEEIAQRDGLVNGRHR